jgi:UrcA family protein
MTLQSQAIALMATALLSGGALAQQIEGITVQASRVEKMEVGRTSSGLPVWVLSVDHVVSYADLDLTTAEGMATLKSRIREAARHGCREIGMDEPTAQPEDWVCTKLATKEAMDKVNALVAAR